jgi:hypothetical protein
MSLWSRFRDLLSGRSSATPPLADPAPASGGGAPASPEDRRTDVDAGRSTSRPGGEHAVADVRRELPATSGRSDPRGRIGTASIRALTANCPRIGQMKRFVLAWSQLPWSSPRADRRRRQLPSSLSGRNLLPRRLATRRSAGPERGCGRRPEPTRSGAASGTRSRALPGDPWSAPIRGSGDGSRHRPRSFSRATSPGWLATALVDLLAQTASRLRASARPWKTAVTRSTATGSAPGCKVQATVKPMGGETFVTILYGAACPHD